MKQVLILLEFRNRNIHCAFLEKYLICFTNCLFVCSNSAQFTKSHNLILRKMAEPANMTASNFTSSSIFENLMKKFDQSCEHLDLQIVKLNQKKKKEEEKKSVDLIPIQSHSYSDLLKNDCKIGDESFENVTVIEDTNGNSTLTKKKRKGDKKDVIDPKTNKMVVDAYLDLPLRKKRTNRSLLNITNQVKKGSKSRSKQSGPQV